MMVFLFPIVHALDICTDRVDINTNCTMVTPTLSCTSYTYTIYGLNGSVADSGSLLSLAGNMYQFNFTLGKGDYLVELCDGSTREVRVKEDEDNMLLAAITIIPMIFGVFALIGAASLGDDHRVMKIFLFLLSILTFFTSLHFGLVNLVKFYDFPELEATIGTTVYWTGWIFAVIIMYFIIYAFYKVVEFARNKKKARLEY